VESVLRETSLPPELLCLEITESVFAGRAPALVASTLAGLRGLGIRLALDDFGTGYSAFSYLGKLPFDKVKIDRSFVAGIDSDGKKRALLHGMVELIHSLGARAVGEGAESEAELAVLADLGIDCVQGFVIGKAVPSPAIPSELARIEGMRPPALTVRREALGVSA
jgi:EAL domain-containing protein (putative c-di-GMP-specific phosphodiesterase class I)